jgi:hypothetical protein
MKTSELTGAALDWAVSIADGWTAGTCSDTKGEYLWLVKVGKDIDPKQYRPSSNWMQGGPIIEREEIELTRGSLDSNEWVATIDLFEGDVMRESQSGETPLIAAMRCYVASKLGAEVQIPEELTNE